MVQLIVFLLAVAVLVILVLQNLSPLLPLVVLGRSVGTLPLSLWLLGAIAIGVLCALLVYQLVPSKRSYRPMGKRLSDPMPGNDAPNRFVDAPVGESVDPYVDSSTDESSRSQSSSRGNSRSNSRSNSQRQNPYDTDWESFKAPEQWDDWGQRQVPSYGSEPSSNSADDAVRDIESGWGDDGYRESARASFRSDRGPDRGPSAGRMDLGPDMGWDVGGAEQPSSRTYEEGWLYGNDSGDEPVAEADKPEDSEDVYDANYRVIIPPYDAKDS
ncbi:hypothetical protein [Leptothoe sp. PORK10 BA2]|uniref:hypothetical protein n=1 Tax=Leptothoe sp. PORK10 BA2 TaxID=3110254 RepID=UPI002B20FE19|nr:hypothetical protein [Leptothoe sp. PORK10 BA2]MEA5466261.1 hypothetical protein [Leptothoe sp. PORK10 BA2]